MTSLDLYRKTINSQLGGKCNPVLLLSGVEQHFITQEGALTLMADNEKMSYCHEHSTQAEGQ